MNFYLVNGGLILPQFDDPADSEAKSILQNIWPDRQIILVADEDFRVGERGREDEKCIAFSTASQ
jgi:agmatine deiminase